MKVIGFGNTYKIQGDDLQTYEKLPVATYKINFNPMSGFSLEKTSNFKQKEEKIYGDVPSKVEKTLKAFSLTNRSIGVLLSGDKGMGKSLFTQLLAERSLEEGMPVILVSDAIPGIADYLESIEQEVLVIFDEFEKVFNGTQETESQDKLLGLFDGTSRQKRLYAITVNDMYRVSSFMVNRPGRFHYHIQIKYPEPKEVAEYMTDVLTEDKPEEVGKVVRFSKKRPLNYDSLRAIAFEINMGETFEEAIEDLNISNDESPLFKVEVFTENDKGEKLPVMVKQNAEVDLFQDKSQVNVYGMDFDIVIQFSASDIVEQYGVFLLEEGDAHILDEMSYTSGKYENASRITKVKMTPFIDTSKQFNVL